MKTWPELWSVLWTPSWVVISETWLGPSVVFLGKTLHSHSFSLHPGEQMDKTNCQEGVMTPLGDGLASHHPGGSSDSAGHFMPWKPG